MTSPPCPHCGEPTDADDRYCAGCGGELPPPPPPELRCEKCGEIRDLEDLYCAVCGEKLPLVSPEPSGQESRLEPSPLTRETAERSAGETSTADPALPDEAAEAPPAPAKTARKKAPKQPKPAPDPQPVPYKTERINRWWPESRGGRTAYGAILAAAGLFGFIAGEGNPLGAVITPVLALIILTFWRNVWISWGGGPTRVPQVTGGQAPASAQSAPAPQADDGAQPAQAGDGAHVPGGPDEVDDTESSGGSTLEKVLGIAILLGLLALVRAFGPQVLEVLF